MKLKINLKKEVPYFLLQETVRIQFVIRKSPYDKCYKMFLIFLSQDTERCDNKLDALFDGYLDQEVMLTSLRQFIIRDEPITIRTDALKHGSFSMYSHARSNINGHHLKASNLFKARHNDEFWMVVELLENNSLQLSLLARNDRGMESTLIEPITFSANEEKVMEHFEEFNHSEFSNVRFIPTGEPMSMSGQLLNSGTIFSMESYGLIKNSYEIIPPIHSDVLVGNQMGINPDGLVHVTMDKISPPETIDCFTDKKVPLFKDQTTLIFDGLTQREDFDPIKLDFLINRKFEDSNFTKNLYKKKVPAHFFAWYKKMNWSETFEMGIAHLKSQVSSQYERFAPNKYYCFLSETVAENKFKAPLGLEIMDVIAIYLCQGVIKDELIINTMVIECIRKMYSRYGLATDIFKTTIPPFEEDQSSEKLLSLLTTGREKQNRKNFFPHYREEVMRKERLPDLYYPNIY